MSTENSPEGKINQPETTSEQTTTITGELNFPRQINGILGKEKNEILIDLDSIKYALKNKYTLSELMEFNAAEREKVFIILNQDRLGIGKIFSYFKRTGSPKFIRDPRSKETFYNITKEVYSIAEVENYITGYITELITELITDFQQQYTEEEYRKMGAIKRGTVKLTSGDTCIGLNAFGTKFGIGGDIVASKDSFKLLLDHIYGDGIIKPQQG